MSKRLWLPLFSILIWISTMAQDDSAAYKKRDLIDVYRQWANKGEFTQAQQTRRDSNKVYFSFIPAPGAGGNKGFVTAFAAVFYLGDKENTNMSTVYFTPYFTFSDQWVIPVRTYIWTRKNRYNFSGDYRYMKYPQETYELGAYSSDDPQSRVNYYQIRFYQNVTHKFRRDMAFGVGMQLDKYYDIREDQKFIEGSSDWAQYGDSTIKSYLSSGLTLEGIFDSRGNIVNPEDGQYLRITFRRNAPWTGSQRVWNSLYVDGREYFPFSTQKHSVLALWAFYWTVFDFHVPVLDLPSVGWDFYGKTGRGHYRNRYRSTGMLYGEAEYRTDITRNGLWGAVFFSNITAPAVMYTQHYPEFNFAFGTGLRLKFDKRTGGNIGTDIAFSRNYWTWYSSMYEYF